MSRTPFAPRFAALPRSLPVFPLPGGLLLPGGKLPLRVFEQRYLNMLDDTMASDRLIGMVQPLNAASEQSRPEIYQTGCAGRVTSLSETDEGHYLITLTGLIRFAIAEELPLRRGYRRVVPDYAPFECDLSEDDGEIDRSSLLDALAAYLKSNGIEGDWDTIVDTPDERLVTSLAMVCPFDPTEKQALLEAYTLPDRAETMITILQMSVHEPDRAPSRH